MENTSFFVAFLSWRIWGYIPA